MMENKYEENKQKMHLWVLLFSNVVNPEQNQQHFVM